jgi:hypothetical protein
MSAKDIIMGQVFPIVGGILSTIMYCSPVKATYTARKNNALGVSAPAEGGKAEQSGMQSDQQAAMIPACYARDSAYNRCISPLCLRGLDC